MRIVFAGTSEFSSVCLDALMRRSHRVVGVVTKRRVVSSSRNRNVPNAVEETARRGNIELFRSDNDEQSALRKTLRRWKPDLVVVASYGCILRKKTLEIPRWGGINVHASLLPRWRGSAPIQRALLAGDRRTGVTVVRMDERVDAGRILCQASCTIRASETSGTLAKKLKPMASSLLLKSLEEASLENRGFAQNDALSTYARKIDKKEACLDWKRSASDLERCVRAFNPWPMSYFTTRRLRIRVWKASVLRRSHRAEIGTLVGVKRDGIHVAVGKDVLVVRIVQPEGKTAMSVGSFLDSRPGFFRPGSVLQQP